MSLKPEEVVYIVDSREQNPFDLSPLRMEEGTLQTWDYTLKVLEDRIRVERKSLEDLVGCMTSGRDRFLRELERLMAFSCRCVVVEAHYSDIAEGNYRSQLNPVSALNTVASWQGRFRIPFNFCGSRKLAEEFTGRFLWHEAKRWFERSERFRAEMGERHSAKVSA